MNDPTSALRTDHSHRRILLLALPITLSNLSVPLVGLVDTAVMGHLPDPALVGAVALGATLFSFLYWAFGFLRMGTTGLMAQAWGRQDGNAMREIILRNFLLAAAFGLLILLVSEPLATFAVWAFPASDAVESAMLAYYGIRVYSAPATLANYVMVGIFVGIQRTSLALATQLVLNLTNASLSILLVVYYDWGIEGVAIASLIAEYLALACAALLLARLLPSVRGSWPFASVSKLASYLPLMRLNANIFIRTLCLTTAFAWFNARGAAFGDLTLAVNAILMQLLHVLAHGLDGYAHAAESLVGSAIGSRRRADFKWAIRASTQWAFATALVYCAVYGIFGADLVAMITTLAPVRDLAASYLPWVILMPLVAVWSFQLDGIFIGSLRTGQMRNAMMMATVGYLVFSIPAVAWAQNHGLWLSLTVFFVLRALTLGWYLHRNDWRGNPLVQNGGQL